MNNVLVLIAFMLCSLIWGHTNAVMRITFAPGCSAQLAVAIRLTIAALIMLVIWRVWAPKVRPNKRQTFLTITAGVLSGIALVLLYTAAIAAPKLSSGLATTVLALQPSVIVGVNYLRKRKCASAWTLGDAAAGFLGIYLIHRDSAQLSVDMGLSIVILAGSAILYALAYFPLHASEDLNVHVRLTLLFGTMAVVGWFGTLISSSEVMPGAQPYAFWVRTLAFVYLGTIGLVLPYYAFLIVLDTWGKTAAVMTDFTIPLVAIIVDVAIIKQSMHIKMPGAIGIVLVLGSIVLALRRKPNTEGHPPLAKKT